MKRFWDKVEKTDACWVWTASVSGNGYGQFKVDGRPRRAHRVAYEMVVGPIPEGLQLDHLCRVRRCVNPAHLEPVTGKENTGRGILGRVSAERQRSKTRCPRGHPYDEENTYVDIRGWRACRACRRMRASAA